MNPRVRRGNRNHNNHNGSNNNNNSRRFNSTVSRNTVLDSLGPAGKLRGTAFQLMEKYLNAAKDSFSSDRVLAESCLQHAEHYMRLNAIALAAENRFNPQQQPRVPSENGADGNAVSAEADPAQAEQPEITEPQEQPSVAPRPAFKQAERTVPAEARRAEPRPASYAAADLSVPVAVMSEKAREVAKERTLTDVSAADGAPAVPPMRRRGRPAKKKIEIAVS